MREKNLELGQNFVTWMIDPEGGQAVVKNPEPVGICTPWPPTARQNQSGVWDGEGSSNFLDTFRNPRLYIVYTTRRPRNKIQQFT